MSVESNATEAIKPIVLAVNRTKPFFDYVELPQTQTQAPRYLSEQEIEILENEVNELQHARSWYNSLSI
jgi:hypothetical protein